MKKNNENEKRTFVPKSIGDTLKNINQIFSSKFNKNDFIIYKKWYEIVGPFFANHSEPMKISSVKNFANNSEGYVLSHSLHVNVAPGAAVEFQHFKNKIIEKINSYFGYKAISEIKIFQNFIPSFDNQKIIKKKKQTNTSYLKEEIKKQTNKIRNKNLEKSIMKLGISINEQE